MRRTSAQVAAILALAAAAASIPGCFIKVNPSADDIVVTRLEAEPPVREREHGGDLWSALGDLHTDYRGADRVPGGARDALVRAAELFLARDYPAVVVAAESLRHVAGEPVVRAYAEDLQICSFQAQRRWPECLAAIPDAAALAAGDTTAMADPDMLPFFQGWAEAPPESCIWNADRVVLPLKKSSVSHALVPVEVNGARRWFLVDTGAAMTVISSRTAHLTGVEPSGHYRGSLGTTTDIHVQGAPAVIGKLRLGDLVFKNHRAFYMNQRDLEFKLLFIPLVRIEGILGWNAIEQMRLELDFEAGQAVITRPTESSARREREIVWSGEEGPLVRLRAEDGTDLWFFLDTGANRTDLYSDIARKLDLETTAQRHAIRGGAGGMRKTSEAQVEGFALLLDGHSYRFKQIGLQPRERELGPHGLPEDWARIDGVLGMDILTRGRVVIDAAGGCFDVVPAADQVTPAQGAP
jgi:predicted aspartyl protease